MSCGIYKITNKINNKIYIGCSINIEHRWSQHKWESQNSKLPTYNYSLHQAFRKYGIENFSFEIIEECEESLLNEKEIYWIDFYNSYQKGYNETKGGDRGPILKGEENPNAKLTEEDVYKIREAALQCTSQSDFYYNQNYNDKISFRQFSRIWRGEGWENILPEVKDFVQSKEYISTIRSNAAKTQFTQEQKEIWQDIEKRKLNGELRLDVYELYKDIYSLSGFNKIWYKTKEGVQSSKKSVAKIDKETNDILDVYESAAAAGRINQCDSSGILKVCRGVRATAGGYKWRFLNEI